MVTLVQVLLRSSCQPVPHAPLWHASDSPSCCILHCLHPACLHPAGRLLDLLRRIYCFGLSLMKLDMRQESGRHTDCLDEVTQ